MSEELCGLTLVAAAQAVRERRTTAVELTEACLRRARRSQTEVNAFITIDAEGALAAARRADADAARGAWRGPLHGVPLAHKDMFDRAGRRVTHGSRLFAERRPAATATVLRRLDAAGAIDLGGLNMSEFACNPFGLNVLVGPARNPWAHDRIAGGSSSGSAAAVAACLVYGALGSDTGGSVRLPAALCGAVGLLPTRGRVSRHGAMKLSPSLDAVGPIARTARDCARLFAAIAGPDPADPTSVDVAPPDVESGLDSQLTRTRIGVPSDRFCADLASNIGAAISRGVNAFREFGAEPVEVPVPDFDGLNALAACVMLPEMAALHRQRLSERASEYTPWVHDRLSSGLDVPAIDYIAALCVRARVTAELVDLWLGKADALLLPVHTESAPRLNEILDEIDGRKPPRRDLGLYTRWTNYLGLPAITVPAGLDEDRLPSAFQIVGRPFSEPLLLNLAHRFEAARDTGNANAKDRI